MRLHIYHGLDGEIVPKDVTHVIVDNSVTVIKKRAFFKCFQLVSLIMGDNVKRIEEYAFIYCRALRFIRLSKALKFIGAYAFYHCESLEALFLQSTVKSIGKWAFSVCRSMRLLILPHDMDLSHVDRNIINGTGIQQIAEAAGVEYDHRGGIKVTNESNDGWAEGVTNESNRRVNEWLFHHMDEAPFHKLCSDSSVTTKQISDYLHEHGNDSALAIDPYHGMNPLHILSMNPHAPADAIAALFDSNIQTVFCADNQQKTPLEYARDCNVGGLIQIINGLCNHRNSSIPVELSDMNSENTSASKRRKVQIED